MQTVRLDPHVFDQIFKQAEFPAGIIITFQVMTVSRMSPGHPYAVGTVSECGQNEFGTHPSRAGDTDHPDVRGILHTADTCKISGAVSTPIAEESDYFRFPVC